MIMKYRPERIYNPKDFKNEVRRASKLVMERRLTYVPLTSRASRLLFCIPVIGFLLKQSIKLGQKLILKFQGKELLESKEEHNGITIHN